MPCLAEAGSILVFIRTYNADERIAHLQYSFLQPYILQVRNNLMYLTTTMSRTIYIMTLVLATFSCGQINEKKEEVKTAYSAHLKDNKEGNWYDKLIKNYIDKSENELIKLSRKDSTIKIEWLMDRVENTDTTKYLVFRVGHDVVEEENINKRFVTDGWIYIDSLTKQIYEYDLPNDSLIEWEQ